MIFLMLMEKKKAKKNAALSFFLFSLHSLSPLLFSLSLPPPREHSLLISEEERPGKRAMEGR